MELLKTYEDIFVWTYEVMLGLDPSIVIHSFNVDIGTKPVIQLARVFHTEMEAQVTHELKKLLVGGFIKPI